MNENESFRERVQALVAEGKLTPEEAEALLGSRPDQEAVSTAPQTPVTLDKTEGDTPSTAVTQITPLQESPAVPFDGDVPPVLHLIVAGFSLSVRTDESVTAPHLHVSAPGRVQLAGTPEGWLVKRVPLEWQDRGEGWLDRLVGGFVQEGNLRAELVVPAGITEVNAKVQGGNLGLPDLNAPVNVKVQGGNLTLGNASDLHARVQGGNLRWNALVSGGTHDVKVQGGNANVQLQPGSSVRLDGEVTAGNMSASGFPVTKTSRDFVNSTYSGVLADGRASLALTVQGGNAKVVAS
ncbi:hypothetical protein [Deinococcus pimensis]|uniref:hypothetical protein n=1 Tax=Deinococcus pimensis TaxID=309888 RepID=UPI000489B3EF|nr:hypothetical protein [Deinococcus pimensis]